VGLLDVMLPGLPKNEYYGVLARFETPKDLFQACEKVRDAGYSRWDAHTPFPVHGLDAAMGLKSSRLPWLCLVMGLSGAAIGMGLQWWVHTQGYVLNISGKPLFSWQAFVPVTFELGVLGGALGAVGGMLAMNQLPMLFHPLFHSKAFERVTDDGFFVSIESWDPKFDAPLTRKFLEDIGGADVELIESGR
jgi:hypothetical protein